MKSRFESRNIVNGQLKLPTQGSSGGILIGGDVQLYRSAADRLQLNDNLMVGSTYKSYFRDTEIYLYSNADGELTVEADLVLNLISPELRILEYLKHHADTDTYIRYLTNEIRIVVGNAEAFRLDESTGARVSFFGKTPVAQPVHLADPTDLATCITAITQLIDNQKALGLMAADP